MDEFAEETNLKQPSSEVDELEGCLDTGLKRKSSTEEKHSLQTKEQHLTSDPESEEAEMKEDDDYTELNLCDLPDLVLVEIFDYLPLSQQYRLSVTCTRMYDIFNHPSLWHTKSINLCHIHMDKRRSQMKMLIPEKYVKVVEKFGHRFQNLTLNISGSMINKLSPEGVEILEKLGSKCRLESLCLEIGQMSSYHHLYHQRRKVVQDLGAILSFLRNAFRLKTFKLKTWPFVSLNFLDAESSVLSALLQNEKLNDLEHLELFWGKSNSWSERLPVLPCPKTTLIVIQHFQQLTSLSLRSPMMNKNLIAELSKPNRANLKLLRIFLHHDRDKNNKLFALPDVPSQVWVDFKISNPGVRVECKVFSRILNDDLVNILKPEVPLTSITFMEYSMMNSQIINSLGEKYDETLQHFACYCDPSFDEQELLDFVSQCKVLNQFVFHGKITSRTIIKVAQIKGPGWKRFRYGQNNIQYVKFENEDLTFDEDQVIARDANGDLFAVGITRYHEHEGSRDEIALDMSARLRAAFKNHVV